MAVVLSAGTVTSGSGTVTPILMRRLNGDGTADADALAAGDKVEHYYYAGWRVIEETDAASTPHVLAQTVCAHGVDGQDAHPTQPVCRDRNTDAIYNSGSSDSDCLDSGGSQRYFYHQDANFRVVMLTDESGAAVERYDYDAYGEPRIWAGVGGAGVSPAESGSLLATSRIGNPLMHQGLRRDDETGLHENRMRVLHSRLGRFMQRDPLGYMDGLNELAYLGGRALIMLDPSGLAKTCGPTVYVLTGSWCEEEEVYDAARDEFDKSVHDRTQGTLDGVADNITLGAASALGLSPGDLLGPTFDQDRRDDAADTADIISNLFPFGTLAGKLAGRLGLIACAMSFAAETPVWTNNGLTPISQLEIGTSVITSDVSNCSIDKYGDLSSYVIVTLLMPDDRGDYSTIIRTLQPASAFDDTPLASYPQVEIITTDGELSGTAVIVAIDRTQLAGPVFSGTVVSTFAHESNSVLLLSLEDWVDDLYVTSDHPFYSADRNDWCAASDLIVGESIVTKVGEPARVEAVTRLDGEWYVFNIEVAGDHSFFVGEAGTHAHNLCAIFKAYRAARGLRLGAKLTMDEARKWVLKGKDVWVSSRSGAKKLGGKGRIEEIDDLGRIPPTEVRYPHFHPNWRKVGDKKCGHIFYGGPRPGQAP